ncbi:MAG TPA: hypothetical protein VFN32_12525 [Rhodococcus sp. (in: high G+C Gram-positive bacteria)]|nr:hypothetical protein [Rhodococcus sp. (in: high G+C Gram-positive bacteria)]
MPVLETLRYGDVSQRRTDFHEQDDLHHFYLHRYLFYSDRSTHRIPTSSVRMLIV